jgi:hypothetical protein
MGTFLTEMVPVSLAGSLGNIGRFKLFACEQPDIVLYVAKQPVLTLDSNGRPGVAITTYTAQQPDHSVKIISGAATIGVNTAPQIDQASIDEAKALLASMGVASVNRMRFLPLTTQKGKAILSLPTVAGEQDQKHNDRDVGTPGALLSFLANLTEIGALEWSTAIKNRSNINGQVLLQYEYLRRVPDVGAEVRVHGERVFEHLSAALDVSYNGFFYGGSAKLEAAWDALSRNGGVEIVFLGQGLPPELERLRQEFVATFAKQGMQVLFDQIFAPMPQVAPAQANSGGGIFGGANFAMKWQKKTDAINMTQQIQFRGTTWLTDAMDISLAALFANLDASVLTEVPAQQAFDSVITVDSDPMLSNASVSMTYSVGHTPEAPVFTKDGGTQRYTVVSTAPASVMVTCDTKVNYTPPRWPIIPFKMTKSVGDGGNQMVVKTSSWVGRQTIYMFVREGNKIVPPTKDDYLVLNVSYAGPHLTNTVRDSAKLDPLSPVEFAYPLDPQGRPGEAKFSAFGVINGEMKRAPEQLIPPEDTSLFVLATRGGDIQLVTSQSIIGESDELAHALRQAQARPVVTTTVGKISETSRKNAATKKSAGGAGRLVHGSTLGVEYGADGASLWLRTEDGTSKRFRLRSVDDAAPFEKESQYVRLRLDASGEYAESIVLDLVNA